MSFEVAYSDPWLDELPYSGTPILTPQYMEVSIAGKPYVLDTSFEPYRRDAFRHRSIQAQRESISLTNIPGEGTVNTEGLWRRGADDWHYGAGQPYQDRKDSVDARFSTSKGVNPWRQWQLELLNDTEVVRELSGSGSVTTVGEYAYLLDTASNVVSFSSNLTSWTTVSGMTGTINALASDGYDVWIATTDNLYSTTAGASSASVYIASNVYTGLWYVAQRWMATNGPNLYNIITNSAPGALWTHPSPNWTFTSMAAGSGNIYYGGYVVAGSGFSQSQIFQNTIEATGTALTIPVQALPLEGGEYVTCLYGYLNFIFVGTNLGLRMCRTLSQYDPTGNQGDLESGPIVPGLFPPGPVNSPVYAIVGNNRFVYFGWTNYDNGSTGLGRCDLSTFIDTQAPAFASDLMVTGQGTIVSMDWFNNAPVFIVEGLGLYTDAGTTLANGYVTSGYVGYGIMDNKIVMAGDIGTVQPQSGTVVMSLASDAASNILHFAGQQQATDAGGSPILSTFAIDQVRGELFTVQLLLERDVTTHVTPIVHRYTLKALPGVTAGTTISVVLRMWQLEDIYGGDFYWDPYVEKAFLENLRQSQTLFEYVEGPYSDLCTVDEIDWLPEKFRDANTAGGFQGNLIVYLKTWNINA